MAFRMRSIVASLALIGCALAAVPAHARVTVVETWVYDSGEDAAVDGQSPAGRFVSGVPLESIAGIATFGPFRVTDPTHAALVGITDDGSPAQFAAMLQQYPAIATLEMIECPGTFDDIANLRLGRMIRGAGIATHVPRDGSVRSGAIELFLAGARRGIEEGAHFAVHAWEDDSGLQASDYAADAPENRKYITYYREMGMSPRQASAFYAMTNSVPFESARWLSAQEMRGWVQDEPQRGMSPSAVPLPAAAPATGVAEPRVAYLDLEPALN